MFLWLLSVEPMNGKYQVLDFLRPVGLVSKKIKGPSTVLCSFLKLTSPLCLEFYCLVYREVIKHGRAQYKVTMSHIHIRVYYEMVL